MKTICPICKGAFEMSRIVVVKSDISGKTTGFLCPECSAQIPAPIIVTRHNSLVEYLRKIHGVPEFVQVYAHVPSTMMLNGRHVIGVLPIRYSCECALYTAVDLIIPADRRGMELSFDEMAKYVIGLVTYKVEKVS